MPKILLPREEFLQAIALLREHNLPRAANRLEKLSQDILDPQPKTSKPKTRATRIRGGDGRTYPFKIVVDEKSPRGAEYPEREEKFLRSAEKAKEH